MIYFCRTRRTAPSSKRRTKATATRNRETERSTVSSATTDARGEVS